MLTAANKKKIIRKRKNKIRGGGCSSTAQGLCDIRTAGKILSPKYFSAEWAQELDRRISSGYRLPSELGLYMLQFCYEMIGHCACGNLPTPSI